MMSQRLPAVMPVAFLLLLKSVRQKRKDVFNYFDRPSVPEHFVLLRFGAFPFVPSGYRLKSIAVQGAHGDAEMLSHRRTRPVVEVLPDVCYHVFGQRCARFIHVIQLQVQFPC